MMSKPKCNPVTMQMAPCDWLKCISPNEFRMMMTFHEHPTQEVFNQILEDMGELYQPAEDLTEGLYVTLEGETSEDAAIRKYKLKKEIAAQSVRSKIKYQDPYKLSWIFACTQAHPWLIDGAVQPLLIERALLYNSNSYKDMIITASTDLMFDDTEEGKRARKSHYTTRTQAIGLVLGHAFLRYGASGNLSYIIDAMNIARVLPANWWSPHDNFIPKFIELCKDADVIRAMI